MLFRARPPADRALLPWWHPWLLLRAGWNVCFSIFLGAAIAGISVELFAQVAARLSGDDWREWSERLGWARWLLGCFVAFVCYMAYRMDERTD